MQPLVSFLIIAGAGRLLDESGLEFFEWNPLIPMLPTPEVDSRHYWIDETNWHRLSC